MKQSKNAFTFVELIVVLVIIAILATIGFVSYESYLSTGRDTAKVSLLKDMYNSFGTYSLKSRIPLPENKIDLTASGQTFAYQGDFTEKIANTIGLKGNPYDKHLEIYPNYMLLTNRKDTQLLHFLEDPQSIQAYIPHTYAYTDYRELHPKVLGKSLGIMVDADSLEPLHLVSSSGSYDVVNDNLPLKAYYSQSEYSEGDLYKIIPNQSCKRILDLGRSTGNGTYSISPLGSTWIQVYCDMSISGGGWTLVARSSQGAGSYNNTISENNAYENPAKDSIFFNETMMLLENEHDFIKDNTQDISAYTISNNTLLPSGITGSGDFSGKQGDFYIR